MYCILGLPSVLKWPLALANNVVRDIWTTSVHRSDTVHGQPKRMPSCASSTSSSETSGSSTGSIYLVTDHYSTVWMLCITRCICDLSHIVCCDREIRYCNQEQMEKFEEISTQQHGLQARLSGFRLQHICTADWRIYKWKVSWDRYQLPGKKNVKQQSLYFWCLSLRINIYVFCFLTMLLI